jgi:hypothetical protein
MISASVRERVGSLRQMNKVKTEQEPNLLQLTGYLAGTRAMSVKFSHDGGVPQTSVRTKSTES